MYSIIHGWECMVILLLWMGKFILVLCVCVCVCVCLSPSYTEDHPINNNGLPHNSIVSERHSWPGLSVAYCLPLCCGFFSWLTHIVAWRNSLSWRPTPRLIIEGWSKLLLWSTQLEQDSEELPIDRSMLSLTTVVCRFIQTCTFSCDIQVSECGLHPYYKEKV